MNRVGRNLIPTTIRIPKPFLEKIKRLSIEIGDSQSGMILHLMYMGMRIYEGQALVGFQTPQDKQEDEPDEPQCVLENSPIYDSNENPEASINENPEAANIDIRAAATAAGVRLWEIAERLGMADSSFSRKLRYEFSEDEKANILEIIKDLATERIKN